MKTSKSLLVATILVGGCLATFTAIADESGAAKKDAYPLQTCVVSGEKLGEMGKPYVYKYERREVQFCCKGCLKDFNKDPQKYIKKLDEAEKAAKK